MSAIPDMIGFAVMTVSDSRDAKTDKTGPWLREQIAAEGHAVIDHAIVTDDIGAIQNRLQAWIADPAIHAVIATGGTGLTGRDVTPEAFKPLYDKEMDGFSAVYLFAIPGSMGGCKDVWNHILKDEFDRTHRPCNLVDLLPRLTER